MQNALAGDADFRASSKMGPMHSICRFSPPELTTMQNAASQNFAQVCSACDADVFRLAAPPAPASAGGTLSAAGYLCLLSGQQLRDCACTATETAVLGHTAACHGRVDGHAG